jgi:LysR family transcriptional regulator for bpeEF and oprC
MDQFQAMRVFVRVAEVGSFARAADALSIPNSTVTRLIQGLEGKYKVKLINRTTRRLSLTDAGRALYTRATGVLEEFDQIHEELVDSQSEPSGRIRVNVSVSVATGALIPALMKFQDKYPAIRLELHATDRRADFTADGVDYVIRLGQVRHLSLVARQIGRLAFTTCASPLYLERYGQPAQPQDLETTHPVVAYFSERTGKHYPFDFARGDQRVEVHGRRALSVSDTTAQLSAGLAGVGIIQAPTIAVCQHLEQGRLVPVLPSWGCEAVPVSIVYLPHKHLGAKHRVFVDWVASLLLPAGSTPAPCAQGQHQVSLQSEFTPS